MGSVNLTHDLFNKSNEKITKTYKLRTKENTYNLKVSFTENNFAPKVYINDRALYDASYIITSDSFLYFYKGSTKKSIDLNLNVTRSGVSCSGCSISQMNN